MILPKCGTKRNEQLIYYQWHGCRSKGLWSWNGPIPMAFIMCYFISTTSLKWQNYRKGDHITDCQGLKRILEQEENRYDYFKKQPGDFVQWWEYCTSFCININILAITYCKFVCCYYSGKQGKRSILYLYYFIQLLVTTIV